REAFKGEGKFAGKRIFGAEDNTLSEQIAALQGDERARKLFLQGASFETKSKGPIQALLTDANSAIAKGFIENLKSMPDEQGLRAVAQGVISNLSLDPLQPAVQIKRALSNQAEQLVVSDTESGKNAALRKGISDYLDATGASDIKKRWDTGAMELETSGNRSRMLEKSIEFFEREQADLEQARRNPGIGRGISGVRIDGEFVPNSRNSADFARQQERMVRALEEILTELKLQYRKNSTLAWPNAETPMGFKQN
ncbi:MAG: hypothetical protein IPK83_24215, partial [Planctomycetes bacterium]|nr:hypothetical protein [Planctomycetota bacterium]